LSYLRNYNILNVDSNPNIFLLRIDPETFYDLSIIAINVHLIYNVQ